MSSPAQPALGELFNSTVLTICSAEAFWACYSYAQMVSMNGYGSDGFLCVFLNRSVVFPAFHVTVTLTGFSQNSCNYRFIQMGSELVRLVFQHPHFLSSCHSDFYWHFGWKSFHFRFTDYCSHLDVTISTVWGIMLQNDGDQEKPLPL